MKCRARCTSIVMMVALALVAGCAKKAPQPPAQQAPQAQATAPKQDVFDEFYQEDPSAAANKTAKAAASETFSTKSTAKSTVRRVTASASSFSFVEDGRYVVQVGCVASAQGADRRVQKLKAEGYPAYVSEVDNPKAEMSGRFYRIRIGGFTGVSAARSFGEQAFGEGNYWVDNRANDGVGMEGYGLGSSQPSGGYYTPASTSSSGSSTSGSSEWGSGSSAAPAAAESPAPSPAPAVSEPAPAPPPPAAAAPAPPPPAAQPSASSSSPASATPSSPPPPAKDSGAGWGDDGWGSSGETGW